MNRSTCLVAAMLVLGGCGQAEGAGPLEVDGASLSWEINGAEPSGDEYMAHVEGGVTMGGFGDHERAALFIESARMNIQLSVCTPPLDQIDPDAITFPAANAEAPFNTPTTTLVDAADCAGHTLTICTSGACTQFEAGEVAVGVADENGWREVNALAKSADGEVRITMHYRAST